ncbi:hypothetical protein CkaCkLH20_02512 [Colletotrichum karsti]|uniref:2EXR domain-containing protein n=1 Tax=Colletotrichum karsti TaxID=1095194 RepID=A0A9P6ID79_9PEZI|nr:uncharacterized protein CkaCkLH20_02512 [Colletotrichum karsti]KAF9879701.1 hypothetical protein CkaCkLH20_02512 [Colletotrichum karsti]
MTTVKHQPLLSGEVSDEMDCHPFKTLPLELRLLIWETFGSEPRTFEYKEDTGLIRPSREYRHPRRVGLAVCAESRKAIQALLKPFEHPHDLDKRSVLPAPLQHIPAEDLFYLPPLVYRSRIQAWDSLWTTKPGVRNVGVHWSVLCDERRIAEALKALRRCFVHMQRLVVFVEFKALPEPEEDACAGGIVRVMGPVEDEYKLPSLFSEAHGLTDEFWTWGEMRLAIERVRRGIVGAADVEGVLYCREVEDGPDF